MATKRAFLRQQLRHMTSLCLPKVFAVGSSAGIYSIPSLALLGELLGEEHIHELGKQVPNPLVKLSVGLSL